MKAPERDTLSPGERAVCSLWTYANDVGFLRDPNVEFSDRLFWPWLYSMRVGGPAALPLLETIEHIKPLDSTQPVENGRARGRI